MRSGSHADESIEKTGAGQDEISKGDGGAGLGKITVVGLGPGGEAHMTPRALAAVREADVVAGYLTYVKLIEHLLDKQEVIGTAMMQEVKRCTLALEQAAAGKKVAVVSSGDSGVYGMAGLVLELLLKYPADKRPKIEIVPGISAVSAAASILGAPLMHDFAVISLSDLLTPWELIKKRATLAAEGDFVIALYNPKSKKRVEHIEEIREIVLRHRSPETPVGIVTSATREGQAVCIAKLANFTQEHIDMFSLVIIGNKSTYVKDGYMITPRGYGV